MLTCDWHSNAVFGRDLGAIHMHHCHFKVAGPLVRQRQGQVHERIKLDGMVPAVFLGAYERGLVQALQCMQDPVRHSD